MPLWLRSKTFKHDALESESSIRLIKIDSNLRHGTIRCSLKHFDLSKCPDYIALSYMWGDPTPKHLIYINGGSRTIHTNLWKFLMHARLEKSWAWIWIDSLCLDQASHAELNKQVARMGDIYSQASHVISWLGDDKASEESIRAMTEIALDYESPDMATLSRDEEDRLLSAWKQIFLYEKYWKRVWVFQEVVCARSSSIMCGDLVVDLGLFLRQITKAMQMRPSQLGRILNKQSMFTLADLRVSIMDHKPVTMMEILSRLKTCESTRTVDRVYGLLGLIERLDPDFDPKTLEVNYDKTLSDIGWDIIFTILLPYRSGENGPFDFHIVFQSVGDILGASVYELRQPPRNHERLNTTSASRKIWSSTICGIHDSVQPVLDLFRRTALTPRRELPAGDHSWNYARPSSWGLATSHAWSHKQDGPGQTDEAWGAIIGLDLLNYHSDPYGNATHVSIERDKKRFPWYCATHLWDHSKNAGIILESITDFEVKRQEELTGEGSDRLEHLDRRLPPLCWDRSPSGQCDGRVLVWEIEYIGMALYIQVDVESPRDISLGWLCSSESCNSQWTDGHGAGARVQYLNKQRLRSNGARDFELYGLQNT